MQFFLAILTGILTAIMISFNGDLSNVYGALSATVIIHIVGLIAITIVAKAKGERLGIGKGISFFLYTGGLIGVFTTIFNNVGYGKISISAILALCLLGQTITSLVIDQFGLFHMKKQPFAMQKIFGIAAVLVGAGIMIFPLKAGTFIPVLASLLSGTTIVLSRTVNGRLSEVRSPLQSTFYNYVTGLFGAILLVVLLGRNEPAFTEQIFSLQPLMYCGGLVGVLSIVILNTIVNRIPAFQMTLLSFVGQLATSILIDYIQKGRFDGKNLAGCVMLILGLCIYSIPTLAQKTPVDQLKLRTEK